MILQSSRQRAYKTQTQSIYLRNKIVIKCDNKIENKEYIYFKGNFSGTNLKILYMICNNFSMFIRKHVEFDDTPINDVIKYISILREIPST